MIKTDNRGSNRRGIRFEDAIFGNMGELEVEDQAAGVKYAIDQGIANPDKCLWISKCSTTYTNIVKFHFICFFYIYEYLVMLSIIWLAFFSY